MSRKAEFLDFERIDAFVKTLFGSGLNKVIFAFEPSLIVCTSMIRRDHIYRPVFDAF